MSNKVGSRQFAYTTRGMAEAKKYSDKTGLKRETTYANKTVTKNKKGKIVINTYG